MKNHLPEQVAANVGIESESGSTQHDWQPSRAAN